MDAPPVAVSGARFLGFLEPGASAWDALHFGPDHVTATQAAAVVGLSPWTSAYSLHCVKAGLVPAERTESAAMSWGVRLEPVVADAFAEQHPDMAVAPAGTWQSAARPWQVATPDRLLLHKGRPVSLLEVKTARYADGWGPDGDTSPEAVPLHYAAQVQWQLDTLGLDTAWLAVLIAGSDFRTYRIERNRKDAVLLREAAAAFLADIATGDRPPLDSAAATYETVRRLPDRYDDAEAEVRPDTAERFRAAVVGLRTAQAAKRQAAAALLDELGTARRATCQGRTVATRTAHADGTTKTLIPDRAFLKEAA